MSSNLDYLVELFPNVARSELNARLSTCSDFDILLEDLLAEYTVTNVLDTEMTVQQQLQNIFPNIDSKVIADTLRRHKNDFHAAAEELTSPPNIELANFCDLDQNIVDAYVKRHRGDLIRALVDIVATYNRCKRAWTSRVQDKPSEQKLVPLYVYNESSTEVAELNNYILHNKPLRRLNYAFLKRLLVFFQGDVFKVLETAKRVVDAHEESFTFDKSLELELETFVAMKPSSSDSLRAGPSTPTLQWNTVVLTPRKPYKSQILGPVVSSAVPAVCKVDLHGYLVKEAVELAEQTVDNWWKDELKHREADGRFGKYGYKCNFMEPLDIVTGRGIHSVGGPKIRGSVIKMLTRKGYQYEEVAGRLLVIGRKPT